MRANNRLLLLATTATLLTLSQAGFTGKFFPEIQKALHRDEQETLVSQPVVEASPKVENWGIYASLITNNIGFEFGGTMDLSGGYELPFYSQNQYTVWEQRLIGLLGGKSYITISLYFFRVTVFFEVIGAKFMPVFKIKYDTVGFNEVCYSGDWFLSTL